MNDSFNDLTVEKFVNMIREIVRDVLKESQRNVEKYYNGVVTATDGDSNTATVDVGDMVLDSIPNRTGLVPGDTLLAGDAVRVYSSSAALTDAYIGVKLN